MLLLAHLLYNNIIHYYNAHPDVDVDTKSEPLHDCQHTFIHFLSPGIAVEPNTSDIQISELLSC